MDDLLKLRISGSKVVKKKDILTSGYKHWRANKTKTKEPFFAVYKDIEPYLYDIDPGPLKLYIYYGFASGNDSGYSWHAINTIADNLKVNKKTVEAWNKKLEDYGLITRFHDSKPSKSTYLLPLSDYAQDMGSKKSFEDWIDSVEFTETYTKIDNYYLFVEKKGNKYHNYFVVEVSKDYGTYNKRKIYYYYVNKSLNISPSISVDEELDDLIYRMPHHTNLSPVKARNPSGWFVNKGVNLATSNDIVELSHQISNAADLDNFIQLEWEVTVNE